MGAEYLRNQFSCYIINHFRNKWSSLAHKLLFITSHKMNLHSPHWTLTRCKAVTSTQPTFGTTARYQPRDHNTPVCASSCTLTGGPLRMWLQVTSVLVMGPCLVDGWSLTVFSSPLPTLSVCACASHLKAWALNYPGWTHDLCARSASPVTGSCSLRRALWCRYKHDQSMQWDTHILSLTFILLVVVNCGVSGDCEVIDLWYHIT